MFRNYFRIYRKQQIAKDFPYYFVALWKYLDGKINEQTALKLDTFQKRFFFGFLITKYNGPRMTKNPTVHEYKQQVFLLKVYFSISDIIVLDASRQGQNMHIKKSIFLGEQGQKNLKLSPNFHFQQPDFFFIFQLFMGGHSTLQKWHFVEILGQMIFSPLPLFSKKSH